MARDGRTEIPGKAGTGAAATSAQDTAPVDSLSAAAPVGVTLAAASAPAHGGDGLSLGAYIGLAGGVLSVVLLAAVAYFGGWRCKRPDEPLSSASTANGSPDAGAASRNPRNQGSLGSTVNEDTVVDVSPYRFGDYFLQRRDTPDM